MYDLPWLAYYSKSDFHPGFYPVSRAFTGHKNWHDRCSDLLVGEVAQSYEEMFNEYLFDVDPIDEIRVRVVP